MDGLYEFARVKAGIDTFTDAITLAVTQSHGIGRETDNEGILFQLGLRLGERSFEFCGLGTLFLQFVVILTGLLLLNVQGLHGGGCFGFAGIFDHLRARKR